MLKEVKNRFSGIVIGQFEISARANLSGADLRGADLSGANLSRADLRGADLRGADLSGAEGLLESAAWLMSNFQTDDLGIIVYKAFGDTYYTMPESWKLEIGEFITEICNMNRVDICGCGVNFATLNWIKNEFSSKNVVVWKCRIRWIDLAGMCVPYNTDGKARCSKLELLEKEEK